MNDLYEEILFAREQRFAKIQFLKNNFKTVIAVKTNFPGLNKNHKLSYLLTDYFCKLISNDFITSKEYFDGKDGPFYLIGSDIDALRVKTELMDIEDNHPIGRFIDFDVFDGKKTLSRDKFRKCYLCKDDAITCSREQKHSTRELVDFMNQEVLSFFKGEIKQIIDDCILLELNLDPKFGLVTPCTNGSHKDMSYQLMIDAKNAILPFFEMMFEIGWSTKNFEIIFSEIRLIGLKAEEAMYNVTGNVNAYKGLIFDMGILVTSYSYVLYNHLHISKIFNIVKKMSKNILNDFNEPSTTFGYYAYKEYNVLGARGELYNGIPNVKKALEYLVDLKGESRLRTLMFLISRIDDTSLLKRANSYDLYKKIKKLFSINLYSEEKKIRDLNDYCIDNNLTFGGSADLLILTIFLKKIMQ